MDSLSNWTTSGPATEFEAQTGVWTNWSRGRVMGATLTLSRQNGNLLIAFTAFFIGLVSSRFWRIACFLLHRCYSTPRASDVLHHQRQAILRNSPNPESGLWTFGQLAWSWRRAAQHGLVRALPGLVSAVASLAAFTVASGFSSRISTGISDEVLIKSGSCGYVDMWAAEQDQRSYNLLLEDQDEKISAAANYAQQCYEANATDVFSCDYFTVSRLPTTLDTDAPCPFASGMCRSSDGDNLRLDSGYLNSHGHFGINAPPGERILFRQVMQCAPLNTIGFESGGRAGAVNYSRYDYGPYIRGDGQSFAFGNWTYEAPDVEFQYNLQDFSGQSVYGRSYQLAAFNGQMLNGSIWEGHSAFVPADGLSRSDADIVLYFLLGNGVKYEYQTYDPWYRGTVPGTLFGESLSNQTMMAYLPEEAASPMGCTQQFQFCNADTQHCGPLAGYVDAAMGAGPQFGLSADEVLFANSTGNNPAGTRFLWFAYIPNWADSYFAVRVLGPRALLSIQGLTDGFQGSLPTNQWKHEVAHWWSTALALQQTMATALVRGPRQDLQAFRVPPQDAAQEAMCANQKVRSTVYTSFSLFGLYMIFVAGALTVLMSYILEPIFACLQRRHAYKPYKLLEWQTSEPLQLQRIAYQSLGQGTWSRFTDIIPLEAGKGPLGPLALLHHGGPGARPVGVRGEKSPWVGKPVPADALARSRSAETAATDTSSLTLRETDSLPTLAPPTPGGITAASKPPPARVHKVPAWEGKRLPPPPQQTHFQGYSASCPAYHHNNSKYNRSDASCSVPQ